MHAELLMMVLRSLSTMTFVSVLFFLFSFIPFSLSQASLRGILIDCGTSSRSQINGLSWLPDAGFVSTGTSKNLTTSVSDPTLSTVRSFPLDRSKHCYVVKVFRGARYMIRTTYYYGGINGRDNPSPPVFDQIVDGTLWGEVNTTQDYANGMATYYEGVFLAQGKTMSLCIVSNPKTKSEPFISALEFVMLGDTVYNTTDFNNFWLSLIARNNFGYSGPIIRYPDDQFDRLWQPYGASNPSDLSNSSAAVSGFWNLPPLKVFESQLAANKSQELELQWPPGSLPNASYYISLYFADSSHPSSQGSTTFDIRVNGVTYFSKLDVTPEGVVVFSTRWPLNGPTTIKLSPAANSTRGPLINAGEVFEVRRLEGRTLTKDVISLEKLKVGFKNPPLDWNGDPCLPRQYTWTGITCSEGPRVRVTTLNITGMGLSGSLSPYIANLTGLTDIWLGNNNISGPIPDLSSLKMLKTLHLEDNHFSGGIPSSLGNINGLHEIFLQNNNLSGQVPTSLSGKPGLQLNISGNNGLSPPAS